MQTTNTGVRSGFVADAHVERGAEALRAPVEFAGDTSISTDSRFGMSQFARAIYVAPAGDLRAMSRAQDVREPDPFIANGNRSSTDRGVAIAGSR